MMYKFSVIIPIYNVEKYLEQSIDSIINQSIGFRENIQLILVDDGSTDGSKSICDKYAARFPENIKYIYQENQGASAARNTGMEHIEGKYVNFLDGDDIWELDAFEKAEAYFDEHYNDIDVISCRIKIFEQADKYQSLDFRFKEGNRIVDINETPWDIHVSVSSSIIKADALDDIHFDSRLRLGEDAKFLTGVIIKKEKYGLMADVLYYYRKRYSEDSATQILKKDRARYIDTSEHYYKGMYRYSEEKYGRLLPYIQYLVMNAVKYRITEPNPEMLSDADLTIYTENLLQVIRQTDDEVFLKLKGTSRNTRLYMFSLKYGKEFTETLEFRKGNFYFRDTKIGSKLSGKNIFLVTEKEITGNTVRYSGKLMLSAFMPEFSIEYSTGNSIKLLDLEIKDDESKVNILNESPAYVFSWEISLAGMDDLPELCMIVKDYKTVLEPKFELS